MKASCTTTDLQQTALFTKDNHHKPTRNLWPAWALTGLLLTMGLTLPVQASGTVSLENTLVAENTNAGALNLRSNNRTFTASGYNLIGDNSSDPCPATGTIWYVDAAAGSGGNGASWICAFQQIQEAINAAANGDQILVAAGTYVENLFVNKSLTITGAGRDLTFVHPAAANYTLHIDGNAGMPVLAGNVSIEGFTFADPQRLHWSVVATDHIATGLQLTLSNNRVTDGNRYGWWDYHSHGSLLCENNIFSDVYYGMLLEGWDTGTLTIQNNEFTNLHFYIDQMGNENPAFGGPVGILAMTYSAGEGEDCTNPYRIFENHFHTYFNDGFGIVFNGGLTGNGAAKYTDVEIARNTIAPGATGSGIRLRNLPAPNNSPNGGVHDALVHNNFVSDAQYGLRLQGDNPGTQAHENSLVNCSTLAIENTGTPVMNATCNWYGSSTVTSVNPQISGNVTYLSWLVNGMDNAPGTPGFQPVPGTCIGCPQPVLQTTINTNVVTTNNNGTDDTGSFSICNGETVVFNNFEDISGLGLSGMKVYQTATYTNLSPTFCNNCADLLSAYTDLSETASLVNTALSGTIVLRFRAWTDDNGDNMIDSGECAGDWVQYTITVLPLQTYYYDFDGDGYGQSTTFQDLCSPSGLYTALVGGDCDDSVNTVYPDAPELCDDEDNDCNGMIDEGVTTRYYYDFDGDGYGQTLAFNDLCAPTGLHTALVGDDCNDSENTVYPGAPEICDNKDNDCNSLIDDGVTTRYYYDNDGDGYGESVDYQDRCSGPIGSYTALVGDDCNDNNATIYPDAPELCDIEDNDCDGMTDEDLTITRYYLDLDGDGYGQTTTFIDFCALSGFYTALVDGDCDDMDNTVYPNAPEICDGKDNDCNSSTDEGVTTRYYYDLDGDGYGEAGAFIDACAPDGLYTTTLAGDCTANDATVYPNAPEICDSKDNDCNGMVDDGITFTTYYQDNDGDSFGNPMVSQSTCNGSPMGYVVNDDDCDDTNAAFYPGATELCDGIDNNCDGSTDEGLTTRYYYDFDGDGYGEAVAFIDACAPDGLYTATLAGDCGADDATVYPNAPEICDGKDNDCNGQMDEGVTTRYYYDLDGDGYGEAVAFIDACAPSGFYTATVDGDCVADDADIYPGATEICDGKDNNCDGVTDEGFVTRYFYDNDGDGYGQNLVFVDACAPDGFYTATAGGDCNDGDVNINPGMMEVCNDIDDDCNGMTDDGFPIVRYYYDGDADGFGESNAFRDICGPLGLFNTTLDGDCNDGDNTIYPDAPELCDGKDNNCDEQTDEELTFITYYTDSDGDGYGTGQGETLCANPGAGFATQTGDCNDNDDDINPGEAEICDGIDNNCNEQTDEELTFITYYTDSDGDGYGTGQGETLCANPGAGFATQTGDCNDNDDNLNPGESEICDGIDNNCNEQTDEELTLTTYYTDADGDGYGTGEGQLLCANPGAGFATQAGDCNDINDAINPAATESCDGMDNNCDEVADEGLKTEYYADNDGDGFGDPINTVVECNQPQGYVANNDDCDDADDTVYPGAEEICDNKDNDCNGVIDDVGGALTGNWNNGNVGNANGSANFPPCNAEPADIFTINATGFSTSSSDKLHAVYQTLCGNGEIIAHVVNVQNGGWAGIMLRETLDPGSKKVALKTQLTTNIRREIRTTTNGAASILNTLRPGHTWLRLVRNGSNFTGYTSPNGSAWTFAFTATISMTGCIYAGLFAESINANVTTTATFDHVRIIHPVANFSAAGGEVSSNAGGQTPTIDVYPNPTQDRVTIVFTEVRENRVNIRVFNALGEQVLAQQSEVASGTTTQLNLADLADGVYTLRVEAQGQVAVTKRIVLAKSSGIRP